MTRTCDIEGCERPHRARGWCGMHYERWAKYGDPMTTHARKSACGDKNGYARHKRRGEEPCEDCRKAMNRYNQERRAKARKANMPAVVGTCNVCDHPMVARNTPHFSIPAGHRKAQNDDTCKRCYDEALRAQKAREAGREPINPAEVDETEEQRKTDANQVSLAAYNRKRNERIARAKRLAAIQAKYGRAA